MFAAAAGAGALVMLRTGGGGPLGKLLWPCAAGTGVGIGTGPLWAGALSICMPGICTVVACVLGTGVLGPAGPLLGAGALVTRGAAGGVAFWIGRLASGAVGCVAGCDTSPTDVTTGA